MVQIFFFIASLLVSSFNGIVGKVFYCEDTSDLIGEGCRVYSAQLGADETATFQMTDGFSPYGILNIQFYFTLSPSSVYYIPASLFTYFVTLENLQMNNVKMQEIRSNTFLNAANLQFLVLSSNEISTLGADVFKGANELNTIYLDSNQLSAIDSNAFRGLSKLAVLYLHNNKIVTLNSQTFSTLKALIQLSLNNNQISSLDKDIFRNLTNLVTLSLSFNALQILNATIFSNNAKLQFLNLNDNKINALSSQTFRAIYNNSWTLDLRNNICVNVKFTGSPFDTIDQKYLESNLAKCNSSYFAPPTTALSPTALLNDLFNLLYNFLAAMNSSVVNVNNVLSNFTAIFTNFTKYTQ
jgi:Leucine-rich repeat (LRR) protein